MGNSNICCDRPEIAKEDGYEIFSNRESEFWDKKENGNFNNDKESQDYRLEKCFHMMLSIIPLAVKSNQSISKRINETKRDEKAIIIQKKFRGYKYRKLFDKKIKSFLQNYSKNYLRKLYNKCLKRRHLASVSDFCLEGWKQYYPEEDEFFYFNKGFVIPNNIRIYNPDDSDNLEIYSGEVNENNLKHGFGIMTTPFYIRQGTWRNDKFTGWGRELRHNGDVLEGKFENGEVNGKGIFRNLKGNTYIGDFISSKKNGNGELNTDKFHYIGKFKNNQLCGKGKIEFFKDGHNYDGEFRDNEINGKGVFHWKNGDVYEGEMKNGKMNGKGKYIYSDGQIYEGFYVDGVKQGYGKIIYQNNRYYEGEFKNGLPDGHGKFTKDGISSNVEFSKGKFIKRIE